MRSLSRVIHAQVHWRYEEDVDSRRCPAAPGCAAPRPPHPGRFVKSTMDMDGAPFPVQLESPAVWGSVPEEGIARRSRIRTLWEGRGTYASEHGADVAESDILMGRKKSEQMGVTRGGVEETQRLLVLSRPKWSEKIVKRCANPRIKGRSFQNGTLRARFTTHNDLRGSCK